MGIVLYLIYLIIKLILIIPCGIWGIIESLYHGGFKELSSWSKDLAEAGDRYGNVLIKYPANRICIQKDGYKFGNPKETISSVEGKNEKLIKFKWMGQNIAKILNKIEENHCEKSIDESV